MLALFVEEDNPNQIGVRIENPEKNTKWILSKISINTYYNKNQ